MKLTKENGGYFIEDIVLKSEFTCEGRIKESVASILERLAEKKGWVYKVDEQTFLTPNGNDVPVPFMILSERRVYITMDHYVAAVTVIKKLYQDNQDIK
jgi:hypothetical protein